MGIMAFGIVFVIGKNRLANPASVMMALVGNL
jgi:hypothetical protein